MSTDTDDLLAGIVAKMDALTRRAEKAESESATLREQLAKWGSVTTEQVRRFCKTVAFGHHPTDVPEAARAILAALPQPTAGETQGVRVYRCSHAFPPLYRVYGRSEEPERWRDSFQSSTCITEQECRSDNDLLLQGAELAEWLASHPLPSSTPPAPPKAPEGTEGYRAWVGTGDGCCPHLMLPNGERYFYANIGYGLRWNKDPFPADQGGSIESLEKGGSLRELHGTEKADFLASNPISPKAPEPTPAKKRYVLEECGENDEGAEWWGSIHGWARCGRLVPLNGEGDK